MAELVFEELIDVEEGGERTIDDGHDVCGLVADGFWIAKVLVGPVVHAQSSALYSFILNPDF